VLRCIFESPYSDDAFHRTVLRSEAHSIIAKLSFSAHQKEKFFRYRLIRLVPSVTLLRSHALQLQAKLRISKALPLYRHRTLPPKKRIGPRGTP